MNNGDDEQMWVVAGWGVGVDVNKQARVQMRSRDWMAAQPLATNGWILAQQLFSDF